MKGSRCGSLCGAVGSEGILVSVQAGKDVIFDVLENLFLKTLPRDRGESHRALVIKPRHCLVAETIIALLRQEGTILCELLKMSVVISAS